jgi:N-acetylglucosaminyl-diphospho-decaprenol L-rhamnosyltransferase
MRVSIVHWNRPAECLATLEALRQQGVALELTVVDNNSTPENIETLECGLPGEVDLIRLPANLGWGSAHNIVLRRWLEDESTEFCVVSAHDALPRPGCLERLVDALHRRSDWGMACPENGTAEVPSYSVLRGARLRSVSRRAPGIHEEVDYCHGTLAMFRRQCLRTIGLYDERYFAYGDETEIGLRARRAGWKVGIVWGAIVVNPGSWSGSAVIAYLWTRSSLRLARTFGGRLGLYGRGAYVAAVTYLLWLRGEPAGSLSSPRARWLGIRDYLRGYSGGPPLELLARARTADNTK